MFSLPNRLINGMELCKELALAERFSGTVQVGKMKDGRLVSECELRDQNLILQDAGVVEEVEFFEDCKKRLNDYVLNELNIIVPVMQPKVITQKVRDKLVEHCKDQGLDEEITAAYFAQMLEEEQSVDDLVNALETASLTKSEDDMPQVGIDDHLAASQAALHESMARAPDLPQLDKAQGEVYELFCTKEELKEKFNNVGLPVSDAHLNELYQYAGGEQGIKFANKYLLFDLDLNDKKSEEILKELFGEAQATKFISETRKKLKADEESGKEYSKRVMDEWKEKDAASKTELLASLAKRDSDTREFSTLVIGTKYTQDIANRFDRESACFIDEENADLNEGMRGAIDRLHQQPGRRGSLESVYITGIPGCELVDSSVCREMFSKLMELMEPGGWLYIQTGGYGMPRDLDTNETFARTVLEPVGCHIDNIRPCLEPVRQHCYQLEHLKDAWSASEGKPLGTKHGVNLIVKK